MREAQRGERMRADSAIEAYESDVKLNSIDHDSAPCSDVIIHLSVLNIISEKRLS